MVPTLNEEMGIRRVLQDMPKDLDVLVVNGGSADETVEVAKQYRAIVIRQKFGRGKGFGVRTGMEFFLSTKHDVLCMIDGDGSNDPGELPKMVEAMEDEFLDIDSSDARTKLRCLGDIANRFHLSKRENEGYVVPAHPHI
jgi:dolichol-phosphate mannosyltransferase